MPLYSARYRFFHCAQEFGRTAGIQKNLHPNCIFFATERFVLALVDARFPTRQSSPLTRRLFRAAPHLL